MRCELDKQITALRQEIFDLKDARWRLEFKVNDMLEAYRLRARRDRQRTLSVEQLREEGKVRAAAGGFMFDKVWTGGRR
jgi:hypothetical protein